MIYKLLKTLLMAINFNNGTFILTMDKIWLVICTSKLGLVLLNEWYLLNLLQNQSQGRGSGRRSTIPEQDSRRPSSSSVAGGLAPLGRWSLILHIYHLFLLQNLLLTIFICFPYARQGSGSQGSGKHSHSLLCRLLSINFTCGVYVIW